MASKLSRSWRNISACVINSCPTSTPWRTRAVSYTHLDVYKRQPEDPDDAEDSDYAEDSEPATGPPTLADTALYGVAGLVVRSLAPHTEADPAAILLQFLAAFGNLVGPAPHCLVGSTRHGLNLFVVLVGESSKARNCLLYTSRCV